MAAKFEVYGRITDAPSKAPTLPPIIPPSRSPLADGETFSPSSFPSLSPMISTTESAAKELAQYNKGERISLLLLSSLSVVAFSL